MTDTETKKCHNYKTNRVLIELEKIKIKNKKLFLSFSIQIIIKENYCVREKIYVLCFYVFLP